MGNSYLVEIIRFIPAQDWEKVNQMLVSQPFGAARNGEILQQLFRIICAEAPAFSEEKLNKKVVFAQLFPQQPWVSGKLDKLMVELVRHLKHYILISRFLSESNESNITLEWITWLIEHGLVDRASLAMDKFRKEQEQHQLESLEAYELRLRISKLVHDLHSFKNKNNDELYIPEFLDELELFYRNFRVDFHNRHRVMQKGKPFTDLSLEPQDNDYYISKSLYYDISLRIEKLLVTPVIQPDDVLSILYILQKNEERLTKETLWHFLVFLRNLCTILLDNGRLDIVPVLLHISKDNLERGLFFYHGLLIPNAYLNIIQIAIKGNDLEWAIEVTEKYKDLIFGGDKDKYYYRLNKAHCLFELKQYEEALALLPLESSHHVVIGLARRLEVKIYFEMQSELLEYKLMAYRKHLERTGVKTVSSQLNQMNIGFFNILKQIIQSPQHDLRRSQQLLERIQKKKLVSDRLWLIKKASALGKLPSAQDEDH
ncbi:MAG TPA: hypothetical protein VK168_11050 [Saprospiraceae bacterium]|nr:hypothetical protein [Saprospiraceae bacterium]